MYYGADVFWLKNLLVITFVNRTEYLLLFFASLLINKLLWYNFFYIVFILSMNI